jgi:sensor c-di-GMP phosphodiesterase-like protein
VVNANIALNIVNDRERMLDDFIHGALNSIKFNCDNSDIKIIKKNSLNSYVRVLGLVSKDYKISCSSLGKDFSVFPIIDNNLDSLKKNINLTSTTEGEYVIFRNSKKGLVYIVLNKSWIENLLHWPCHNCFHLKLSSIVNDVYSSIFIDIKSPVVKHPSYSLMSDLGYTEITVTPSLEVVRSIDELYEKHSLILSLIVGTIFLVIYFIFMTQRADYESLILSGIKNKEFIPYYQPIIDSRTQCVVGVEILTRWKQRGKIIPPSSFIDYIESDASLLYKMTEIIIDQVIKHKQQIKSGIWYSVNITPKHLENDSLITFMKKRHSSASNIFFELTERLPIKNINSAAKRINTLTSLGHYIKVDDFGVGFGGFLYLQELQVKSIKIDKIFIDTINTDNAKKNVLVSMIDIARKNGLEIIAEGVENMQQVNYLSNLGVNLIQGFVYSKPIPFEELIVFLNSTQKN